MDDDDEGETFFYFSVRKFCCCASREGCRWAGASGSAKNIELIRKMDLSSFL